MTTILTMVNTAILILLFGDRLWEIIKTKILDKTTLDEKLVAAVKDLAGKIKK